MTKRFVAFSCTHVPFNTDPKPLLGLISEYNPDVVVHLGDLFDSSASSVHSDKDEYTHSLLDEYRAGADLLSSVRDMCSKAEFVWCLGNHDDAIQKQDARRIPKQLRSAVHWNNSKYAKEFTKWQQIPYVKDKRGCYQLGQVVFIHGYDAGVNSDETEAIQFANYLGGQAHRLVIRGHTHRPCRVTQCQRTKKIPLPYWYANAGTWCDPSQLFYAQRLDTFLWRPAVVVGETQVTKSPRVRVCWEAEMVAF